MAVTVGGREERKLRVGLVPLANLVVDKNIGIASVIWERAWIREYLSHPDPSRFDVRPTLLMDVLCVLAEDRDVFLKTRVSMSLPGPKFGGAGPLLSLTGSKENTERKDNEVTGNSSPAAQDGDGSSGNDHGSSTGPYVVFAEPSCALIYSLARSLADRKSTRLNSSHT